MWRRKEGARIQIERQAAEADGRQGTNRLATQKDAHAGLEFGDVEGLDQVIVGAKIRAP